MNQNTIGIIISFVFVFLTIILVTVIQKSFKLSNNFSRKLIHIMVGNWIFIALYYFDAWYYAIIGPVAFILINYLSYKFRIFKAMELEEKNPGTIYYAISLTVCTFLCYIKTDVIFLPFLGILAMTWGDGLAAIIGDKWPVKQLREGKSLGGSIAFFISTFIITLLYLHIYSVLPSITAVILVSFLTALLGGLIELYSPKNMDNLTVPLILGLIGFVIGI